MWIMPPTPAPKTTKRTTNKGNASATSSYLNIHSESNSHVPIPSITLSEACSIGLLASSRKISHCDVIRLITKMIAAGVTAIAAC